MSAAASAEDQARANVYALLSRLFNGAVDGPLLASVAASKEAQQGDAPFAEAWRALSSACAESAGSAVQQEYIDVFVGTGQAQVTPYLSHYLVESGHEKILVQLRQDLASLGLARAAGATEPEDHIAGLLEAMRYLALSGDGDFALHRDLFARYLEPAYPRFCDAVAACQDARFYRHAARLLRAFLDVERQAFALT